MQSKKAINIPFFPREKCVDNLNKLFREKTYNKHCSYYNNHTIKVLTVQYVEAALVGTD